MNRDAPTALWTDDADLAVEASHLASVLGLAIAPQIDPRPLRKLAETWAAQPSSARPIIALALAEPPPPALLIEAALAAPERAVICLALSAAPGPVRERTLAIAAELGIAAVGELRPLLAALALAQRGAIKPAVRGLPAADRRRIDAPAGAERGHGRLVRLDTLHIGWLDDAAAAGPDAMLHAVPVGESRDVGEALAALRAAQGGAPRSRAVIDGIDHAAVDEVLFGPPRALSDPASKAVLERYGLPMPIEELCSSPSRAAAEAARIGFPVRVSLASPDLRLWDHPDLAVDGVSSAAGVRDAFRQITALATDRSGEARLLGVHVTAATAADALLYLRATPATSGLSVGELGFADAHGIAALDETPVVLPTTPERLERSITRLRGSELLLGGGPARRRATLESLSDLLVRVAAFLDRSPAVTRLELRPIAILPTGRCEVREACVTVGDAYQRRLDEGVRSA